MSETKHYVIHCDVPHCTAVYDESAPGEVPSRIRPKIKKLGWVSRTAPPSVFHLQYDIKPTVKQDFCPFHAFKIKED